MSTYKFRLLIFSPEALVPSAILNQWLANANDDVHFCEDETTAHQLLSMMAPHIIVINSLHLPVEFIETCLSQPAPPQMLALLPAAEALVERAYEIGIHECLTAPVLAPIFKHTLARMTRSIQDSVMYPQALVEQAHTVIMIMDDAGRVVFINRYGALALQREKLAAVPPQVGQSIEDVMSPSMAAIYLPKARHVIATQKPDAHEYQTSDGSRWFMAFIYPITSANADKLAAIVAYDITEYKLAQLELLAQAPFYQMMYEQPAIGIVYGTNSGIIQQVNGTFAKMLGYTPAEIRGRHMNEITHPDDFYVRDIIWHTFKEQTSDVMTAEKRYVCKDSSVIWAQITVSQMEYLGETNSIIIFVKDISAQKQTQQALKQEKRRFEAVFEQAAIGMTLTSLDRRLLRMNQRFCDILGYTEEELRGLSIDRLIHPDYLNSDQAYSQELINGQRTSYIAEKRYIHKNGQSVWVKVAISILLSDDDTPESFIAMTEDIMEQKIAQDTLRQSEGRMRQIMDIARIGIWEWNAHDDIIQWHGDMFRMYGISPEEFTGKGTDYFAFTHPDDRPRQLVNVEKNFLQAPRMRDLQDNPNYFLEEFQPDPKEFRLVRPDGSICYVRGDAISLLDDAGNPSWMLGFLIDITEAKLAEAKISQKNAELAALLEIAREVSGRNLEQDLDALLFHLEKLVPYTSASISIIEDDQIKYIAQRNLPPEIDLELLSTLFKESDEWQIYLIDELIIIDDVALEENWTDLPSQEKYISSWMGVPIIHRDKLIGHLNIDHVEPGFFTEEHGRQALAVANQVALAIENARLFEELEQRVIRRTAELRLEKEQSEIILNNITDAVIMLNEQGDMLYANPMWQQMLGDYASQPSQENIDVIVEHSEMWQAVRQGENWRGILQLQAPSGEDLDIDMIVVPVQREDTTIFISVLRDISEQRKLDNMKSRFIADAAHDLGNPLAIMTLKMYLLKQQPDKLNEHLPVLEQQVSRLNALVDDLLVVSKLDRRVLRFMPQPLQLNTIVEEVFMGEVGLAEEKQIDLQMDLYLDLPLIIGDKAQLQRVIVNLLVNAINYTPAHGRIYLKTQVEQSQVVLTVKDTGMGIPTEEIDRIFDRFFRGTHVSGTAIGTGLGLSIVHEILSLHGARIEVESEFNIGSTFRLYFNIDDSVPQN